MAAAVSFARVRPWLATVLLASMAGLILGCNPQALNFLLMPFVDDHEQPECKLTTPDKKEITVAIVSNFATLETRLEMLPIEGELSNRVAAEMTKLAKENKEKIHFVQTSKVRNLMNQDPSGSMSPLEIGKKLKADYVITLEINSISLYEKGSFNSLFRGKSELIITCTDVSKPRGECTILPPKIYSREYPGARGPIDASGSSVLEFRSLFIKAMAKDIARMFVAYLPEEMRTMD